MQLGEGGGAGVRVGHSFKLYKRRSRLVVRSNCFSNRVINAWNGLPESVVSAPSVNVFTKRLNKH